MELATWLDRDGPAVSYPVGRCGALPMRLLLLHASAPARTPGHRRFRSTEEIA